jgi:hypothetical protein
LISESPADPKADNVAQNCRDGSGGDQKPNIEAMCSGGENPAPIKAASAGNGTPTLSSAMKAATNQMP